MRKGEIKQRATALVAERRDVVESIASTGDNIQKALAETFLEISAGDE
ncbi:hypothetical protein [uncultured Methanolobus sp.]|nr:hypothetical protein [uncultured Methanolobus sp.]